MGLLNSNARYYQMTWIWQDPQWTPFNSGWLGPLDTPVDSYNYAHSLAATYNSTVAVRVWDDDATPPHWLDWYKATPFGPDMAVQKPAASSTSWLWFAGAAAALAVGVVAWRSRSRPRPNPLPLSERQRAALVTLDHAPRVQGCDHRREDEVALPFPLSGAPLVSFPRTVRFPIKRVRVRDLVAIQPSVERQTVASLIERGAWSPITVMPYRGKLAIEDGHHRAYAAFLLGHETIEAVVTPPWESLRTEMTARAR